MTQDERWQKQYDDVMEFLAKNHRNPSRHRLEEHDMLNWVKQQRKLKNKESGSSWIRKSVIIATTAVTLYLTAVVLFFGTG